MKRKILMILTSLSLCMMLSGCLSLRLILPEEDSDISSVEVPIQSHSSGDFFLNLEKGESPYAPRFLREENETSTEPEQSGVEEEQSIQQPKIPPDGAPIGSATYLGGKSVLVTVYLDDSSNTSNPWTETEIGYANNFMDIAVDYMQTEGEKYDQTVELIYDEADLYYHYDLNADTASDDIWTMNEYLEEFLDESVDENALMEKYGVNSIGYVFLINGTGGSYCLPYIEGDGKEWHREKSFIYLYDIYEENVLDNPATYAHEIMHMFGAVDLYDEFLEDGVTLELVSYVGEYYPMEIMNTTYTDGWGYTYDHIPQYISSFTAYTLGWIENSDEVELFPTLKREYAACFEYKYYE